MSTYCWGCLYSMMICSCCYAFDITDAAISKPIMAPNIAPDQGLAVIPQVLPVHLPKYPITPPIKAPPTIPMT